jgi:hypothetical protein
MTASTDRAALTNMIELPEAAAPCHYPLRSAKQLMRWAMYYSYDNVGADRELAHASLIRCDTAIQHQDPPRRRS